MLYARPRRARSEVGTATRFVDVLRHGDVTGIRALFLSETATARVALTMTPLTLGRVSQPPLLHVIDQRDLRHSRAIALAIVKTLLEYGADVHAKRADDGSSALHLVAQHGQVDIASVLVGHGADWWARRGDGLTPVHCAISHGQVEILQLCHSQTLGLSWDHQVGHTHVSPLFWAVSCGQVEVADCLLQFQPACVDLNYRWMNRLTALTRAVQQGHTALVQLLIVYGADVNLTGRSAMAPLVYAVRLPSPEIAALLLEAGADIQAIRSCRESPLTMAATTGDLKMLQFLVHHGADVNMLDGKGEAALHVAVRYGHQALVRYLLMTAHANVTMPRADGVQALELAHANDDREIRTLLAALKVERIPHRSMYVAALLVAVVAGGFCLLGRWLGTSFLVLSVVSM